MKIKLISDLHLEFGVEYENADFLNADNADVLVLAGDITVGVDRVCAVLEFCSHRFPQTIYVPGNHEYYRNNICDFNKELMDRSQRFSNVHVLNPGFVSIKDVLFVGATLWTNFGNDWFAKHSAKGMISDFSVIKGFSPDSAVELYNTQSKYIMDAVNNPGVGKVCVVTHFLPAEACIAPQYKNSGDLLNKYFANNLDNWIYDYGPDIWMFGHTHVPVDVVLNKTRLVCNPRGYPRSHEGKNFDPHFEVTI
jgi:predicted phosphodiesterase